MDKVINVVIIEDDPYARNWMTLIVARDWRTKVVADLDHPAELEIYLAKNPLTRVDMVVVDSETPVGGGWVSDVEKIIREAGSTARILCTGVAANERTFRKLSDPVFAGYVLKGEIPYSLAWAIHLAMKGKWITTPQVLRMAFSAGLPLPQDFVTLDGNQSPFRLQDQRKANEARLAILFSMERHELANELGIVEGWGYGIVSGTYEEMGLKEILNTESDLVDHLQGESTILEYLEKMKADSSGNGKKKWMETMAFHLLTMPKVVKKR